MSDIDSEHSAESIGSNSSQSQIKSKKTPEKIKITTDRDSCTFAPSSNMDNACPTANNILYGKLAMILLCERFEHNSDLEKVEMKGKEFWDYITSSMNEEFRLSRDDVNMMASKIQEFHGNDICKCSCVGKSFSPYIRDRGPPVLPSEQDLRVWRRHDEVNVKSFVECGTSSNKRLRLSSVSGDKEPFKGFLVSDDSSPEVSSTDYEYRKLVRIYEYFNLPRDMSFAINLHLHARPSLVPFVTQYSESELLSFFKTVVNPEIYSEWHSNWCKK